MHVEARVQCRVPSSSRPPLDTVSLSPELAVSTKPAGHQVAGTLLSLLLSAGSQMLPLDPDLTWVLELQASATCTAPTEPSLSLVSLFLSLRSNSGQMTVLF